LSGDGCRHHVAHIVQGTLQETFVRRNVAPHPDDIYPIVSLARKNLVAKSFVDFAPWKIGRARYDGHLMTGTHPLPAMVKRARSRGVDLGRKVIG